MKSLFGLGKKKEGGKSADSAPSSPSHSSTNSPQSTPSSPSSAAKENGGAQAAQDPNNPGSAGADSQDDSLMKNFMEKTKITDISKYEAIILEDDETSKQRANAATDEDVKRESEILLGPTKEWSSESEEVQAFRESMKRAKSSKAPTTPDGSKDDVPLPPVYLSDDPIPAGMDTNFLCKVHLVKLDMVKTVTVDGNWSAEDFSAFFLEKMNVAHNFNRSKEDWIFKATGTAEYLYGNHKMIEFEHIRRCLKKGVRVELSLMDRDEVVAELDPHDRILKSIRYDIDFIHEEEENKHLKHELLDFEKHVSGTAMASEAPGAPAHESGGWEDITMLSLWDIKAPFRVKFRGLDSIPMTEEFRTAMGIPEINQDTVAIFVAAELVHGGLSLHEPRFTRAIPFSKEPRFDQYIVFEDMFTCDLPRETKICFTAYARPYRSNDTMLTAKDNEGQIQPKDVPIGYVVCQVIDFKGALKMGKHDLRMWLNEKARPISVCGENVGSGIGKAMATQLVSTFEFDEYAFPVMFPWGKPRTDMDKRYEQLESRMKSQFAMPDEEALRADLERIVAQDPLYELSEEEKWRIWQNRDTLKTNPRALAKVMLSVPWKYPTAVYQAHLLLDQWSPLVPIDAIELLDYNFADAKVRRYAINRLDQLSDNELSDLILQLVQTLKYELYHDTSLARLLLQRALRSTHLIGHILFWHLKAEMHVPNIRERYGLLLQEYLANCGGHRRELVKQNGVVEQLLAIAIKIKRTKSEDRVRVLHEELRNNFRHPPKFKLPLSPRMEVKGIIVEKCKVMDSKKLPLWLCFENADVTGDPILTIFKAGDDLRQDLLTLQMLKFCDKLWKSHGLDLHMQPYGCICTGDEIGMIEVVLNSDTIANITFKTGGGATAAFSKSPLIAWLRKQNPKQDDLDKAVQNFVLSCAGYCTATHVFGIGDRHNDNIMLTKKGDLFHIDFGHFLGHFKYFAGIKRESSPFVFTPMYSEVMGGQGAPDFQKFVTLGAQAFNILRKHGHVMINLFLLMLATGIPELTSVEDVMWLRKCLVLDKTEDEAAKHWNNLVKESLGNLKARINDAVHIVAHKK